MPAEVPFPGPDGAQWAYCPPPAPDHHAVERVDEDSGSWSPLLFRKEALAFVVHLLQALSEALSIRYFTPNKDAQRGEAVAAFPAGRPRGREKFTGVELPVWHRGCMPIGRTRP